MVISSAALKSRTHLATVSISGFSPGEHEFLGRRVGSGGSLNNAVQFNHRHRTTSLKRGEKKPRNVGSGNVLSVVTTHNNNKDAITKQVPQFERGRANPNKVAAIILGGGAGTQLFPLTRRTTTLAVPVGGCYRLIDILMSNCINSCINKIFVMTQFNSASLNRHIARTYQGNGVNFRDGFVEVLAATQTPGEAGMKWFQGNADAVRRFLWVFEEAENKDIDNVLILSGDHLYRMDYMDLVQNHIDSNADITLSCAPVTWRRASDFGLMKVDSRGKVIKFSEKPNGSADLKAMQVDTTITGLSLQEQQDAEKPEFLASMGIYVFKTDVLLKLLCRIFPFANDFGSEIIPSAVREQDVHAYIFRDYWEDFPTIKSFYEANLALTDEFPKFQFYDPKTPFFTSPRSLPPTETGRCKIQNSIIAHGCFLRQCTIQHSLVGERSRVGYGVELKDTLLMGADYYQTESEITSLLGAGEVPIGIGSNTKIRNCIIDKNVKIGKDVVIMNKEGVEEADRPQDGFYIRSGITVVVEKATINDGTVI